MRGITIVAIAGVALGVLILPSMALPTDGDGDEVDRVGDLEIVPADGPNGVYASVVDGEIELSLSNLNDEATTDIADIFTITATGEAPRSIWLEHDISDASFYVDRDAGLTEGDPLLLAPDDTASFGLSIDTRDRESATETVTVHATYSRTVQLVDLSVEPTELLQGEDIEVRATYENIGSEANTTVAQFVVDGIIVEQRTITVEAGRTETVIFTREMEQTGTYDVTVDDHEAITVSVESPTILPPPVEEPVPEANVTLEGASIDPKTAEQGTPVTVTATFENHGTVTGDRTIELAVDDVVIDRKEVTVEPEETATVQFETTFDEGGTYTLSVNGHQIGSVVVTSQSSVAGWTIRSLPAPMSWVLFTSLVVLGSLLVVVHRRYPVLVSRD